MSHAVNMFLLCLIESKSKHFFHFHTLSALNGKHILPTVSNVSMTILHMHSLLFLTKPNV